MDLPLHPCNEILREHGYGRYLSHLFTVCTNFVHVDRNETALLQKAPERQETFFKMYFGYNFDLELLLMSSFI